MSYHCLITLLRTFTLKTLTLKKEELDIRCPTIARSLSCARSFAMSVSERSLVWRERESKLEKAAEEICSSGHPSFFLAALRDGGLLEMSCFSSMVSSMVPLANAFWPSHFVFPLWITVFIFWWFVCFFHAPALIFENKWTRNIKNKRHALITAVALRCPVYMYMLHPIAGTCICRLHPVQLAVTGWDVTTCDCRRRCSIPGVASS